MTTFPAWRASVTRVPRISWIFADPWEASVRIPACDPVKLTASTPRAWIAIAISAIEIRSPRRQQHVHLPSRRVGVHGVRQFDELVGGVAHGGHHHHDVVAGPAGGDDAVGHPADPLRVG